MCGIAAIISLKQEKIDPRRMRDFIKPLEHRGDNDIGIYKNRNESVWLGCYRLAITGGDEGQQPLSNKTGDLTVIFNGEIYNYRDLQDELCTLGYEFTSNSDTEVLIHGYAAWGEKITERLRGMYAFLIYDNQRKEFFAARDTFGIKPFYYAKNDGEWAFSSEILPLVSTGFQNINVLQPGESIRNGKRIKPSYNFAPPRINIRFGEAKKQLRKLIQQSVKRVCNTKLEIGVLCSGGIDSSIILLEVAKIRPVTAYCVGTKTSDDPRYARELVKELSTDCDINFKHIVIDKSTMINRIGQTVGVIESFEPNHIRAGTANLALAEEISKDGIKVVLVGEGADELFGGYEEFSAKVKEQSADKEIVELFGRFLRELHKTQLQRVDRVTMAYGIEARVPYLERELVEFVSSLPTEMKLHVGQGNFITSKYILREAYRGILPDKIVDRRKVPMGEGAGLGDNGPKGPFYEHANANLHQKDFNDFQQKFPEFNITNKEEAYYFSIFRKHFKELAIASERPLTNVLSTLPITSRKGLL